MLLSEGWEELIMMVSGMYSLLFILLGLPCSLPMSLSAKPRRDDSTIMVDESRKSGVYGIPLCDRHELVLQVVLAARIPIRVYVQMRISKAIADNDTLMNSWAS